jgi:RNA polymerase sigma-70 factor, ECF subfamily
MSDQELIVGIQNRDKKVIQQLVSKYHKQVIKTAYYFLKSMDDAEDLAQEVCIEILESAGKFKGDSSFSTWIYRITVNKSLNFIRKRKRSELMGNIENLFRKSTTGNKPQLAEPSLNDTGIEDKEKETLIHEAVYRLPENQKTAFILSKYDELSYKQIAEIMNVSLASVESLIQRAKHNLQKSLVLHFSEYSTNKQK